MSPPLIAAVFLFDVLKYLLRGPQAAVAAGRGKRWRLELGLKRRRFSVRGPQARRGARQGGAAPPLRRAGAQQRRLELHGPLQRRPARHARGPKDEDKGDEEEKVKKKEEVEEEEEEEEEEEKEGGGGGGAAR